MRRLTGLRLRVDRDGGVEDVLDVEEVSGGTVDGALDGAAVGAGVGVAVGDGMSVGELSGLACIGSDITLLEDWTDDSGVL